MNIFILMSLANVIGPGIRSATTSAGFTAFACEVTAATPAILPATTVVGIRGAGIFGVGIGYPPPGKRGPQGRLLARRAAEVRATADLARQLGVSASGRLRGVQYVSHRVRSDRSVEVVAARRTW